VNKGSLVMSLKSFVNNKEQWDEFNQYVDSLIAAQHKSMESISATDELYRAQGAIRAYKNMKYMRDVLNGPE
jgi:hypothetical protein